MVKKATKKSAAKKTSKKSSKKAAKKSTSTSSSKGSSAENEKICGILQYFFPIGLIWYLVDEPMKNSAFAKFHLKQSLVLVCASIALNILFSILPFLWVVGWLFHLALFVFWIIGLVRAIQGEQKEIPLIGQFAKYFTF